MGLLEKIVGLVSSIGWHSQFRWRGCFYTSVVQWPWAQTFGVPACLFVVGSDFKRYEPSVSGYIDNAVALMVEQVWSSTDMLAVFTGLSCGSSW